MATDETNVTRRGFIKGTAAAGAGLALLGAAGAMTTADGWLSPAHADSGEEYTAYTYHQSHCGGMCPLACTVRDGRMVSVQPNNCCDDRYETICVKGISEVQHIYGDHRVQTPLRRTGERGAGEFEPISWDEALDEVCDTLKDLQSKHGNDCVVISTGAEANFPWLAAVLGAQVDGSSGIDVGIGNGLDPAIGFGGGYAMATCEARDWVNSKLVLNVGSNFLESSLPNVRLFFEAKEAGTRMVTVDPHFSTTAGKSDQWVPITPGTDAAFFLGMASVIMDEKLYDEDFVLNHTSLPFLVDVSTGKLLRDHAEDADAEEPETGEQNPFFVWDTAAGAKAAHTDAAAKPALEGTFTVDGETYTTVLSLLKKNQQGYDTAWASKVTGIPADTIESLAERYATGGPACIAVGYGGNDKYGNADIAGHAAGLLAAITGNIGRAGGGVGYPGFGYGSAGLGAWPLAEDMKPSTLAVPAFELPYVDGPVKCFIGVGDQIQQRFADLNKLDEWVQGLDFIVYADVYHSTGAQYADLVLPICSRFESDEALGGVRSNKGQVMLRQQVLEPLFESKTDFAFERELAHALGIDASLPKTNEERIVRMLDTAKDAKVAGITLEELQANQGVLPYRAPSAVPFSDGKVPTASGRFDVYFPDLVKFDQALPAYEAPEETGADSKLRDRFPLQLCQMRTRFHIHNQFCDAEWIRQYSTAALHLNPADMEQRGLSNGDTVEAFNDRGSFACPVVGDESVRPGSARIFEGEWSKFMSAGNIQNVTNPGISDRGRALLNGPVIPYNDTLVEVKKA